ncbi:cysteine desulfurase [Caldalkalibacillus thermarum TA2.A1]|uniref:cysteine desulfurase n=1 Tax=Caldalkalibacillus thermarum (strain TA2.A1) TaxID=986075 RepID=A0A8X8IAA5_CALTT|nr:cysteine desulfurase family protein [Caldalkalibacillus thermarum]QZT34382.1 cysteine desulfurase [Caldalkalibacillus thermarum TA2.A1]
MPRYVYLDHAATTPLDPQVWQAMKPYCLDVFGNPNSLHLFGDEADEAVQQAKGDILHLLGAKQGKIVLTSGGTEANNLALMGIAQTYKHQGRHMVISAIEHDSVLSTCASLAKQGFTIHYVPADRTGRVRLDELEQALTEETILVSVMHANNETGVIQPIEDIGRLLQAKRLKQGTKTPFFHCDAVQTVGKIPIQVDEWNIDLLSFSAHKFYSPKGVGGLYVQKGIRLSPLLHGGGQEYGWRSGTQNVPGLIGAACALKQCQAHHDQDWQHYTALNHMMRETLESLPGIHLTVSAAYALPTHIHFRCERIEGQALMQELSKRGVAVSTSSACHARHWAPSHVMLAMGFSDEQAKQAVRISLGRNITKEDIHYVLNQIEDIVRTFRNSYVLS